MEQVRKEKGNYGWHFTSGVPCDVCGAQGRCHIREDGSEVCMECIEKEQAELDGWEGCTRCGRLGPTGLCEECARWERDTSAAIEEGSNKDEGGAGALAQDGEEEHEADEEGGDMQCLICGDFTGRNDYCDDCRPFVVGDSEEKPDPQHGQGGSGHKRRSGAQGAVQTGSELRSGSKRRRGDTEEDEAMQRALKESKEHGEAEQLRGRPHWARLSKRVQEVGCKIVDVQGDGSCFYHAIARQAEGLGMVIRHRDLRNEVCDFFEEKRGEVMIGDQKLEAFVAGDWDYFMEQLRGDSYAEDVVMRAAATILKAEIRVYSSIESAEGYKALRPWVGECHEGRVFRIGHLDISGREHFVSVEDA